MRNRPFSGMVNQNTSVGFVVCSQNIIISFKSILSYFEKLLIILFKAPQLNFTQCTLVQVLFGEGLG
jgi:hypothetical protein